MKYNIEGKTVAIESNTPLLVELLYPRLEGHGKEIEIGLEDVRAADNLRIKYDFDRDGWVVQQASTFSWAWDDAICDEDWQEVAFVQAWGREKDRQ